MTEASFIPKSYQDFPESGALAFKAPSNIALVKYWGKKENQIPANPSISFTLDACATRTKISFEKVKTYSGDYNFDFRFEGESKESFHPKINTFFSRIEKYVPFIREYKLQIDSSNSFPHSSGIASSASGMAAMALCLVGIEKKINPELTHEQFIAKASFLARLGSGSACRSIEGPIVQWGQHQKITGSSDLIGIKYPYKIHSVFNNYHDTILLVDKGKKVVSSTVGHGLMNNHPFADNRFSQAHLHVENLQEIFEQGNLDEFVKLTEREALTLHAMMMTSSPYFLLMKPNTLAIIEKIWDFREQTGLNVCFTLDAGANVHVLYPEHQKEQIYQFIKDELVVYCEQQHYICDRVGSGAKQI
jgi:diphosphomevalonate decarboxylase